MRNMPDRAEKLRYCIARFVELLPKGTSAELAKLYLAESPPRERSLQIWGIAPPRIGAGNEHR